MLESYESYKNMLESYESYENMLASVFGSLYSDGIVERSSHHQFQFESEKDWIAKKNMELMVS